MPQNNWEEQFEDEFLISSYCGNRECEYGRERGKCFHGVENDIKQFISTLRKKDEEEIIKLIPFDSMGIRENIIKKIKDYYSK